MDFLQPILNDIMKLNANILDYKYNMSLSADLLAYQNKQQSLEE